MATLSGSGNFQSITAVDPGSEVLPTTTPIERSLERSDLRQNVPRIGAAGGLD